MGMNLEFSVNITPNGNDYEMDKDDQLVLTFSYTENPDTRDAFISHSLTPSVIDSGVNVFSNSVIGTYRNQLIERNPEPVKYVDSNKVEQTVPEWDDQPIGSSSYYSLSYYQASTLKSQTISYTYEVVYSDEDSTTADPKTSSLTFTFDLINNWDGDKAQVGAATSGGSGKPCSVVANPTSGHGTFPPTVVMSGSSKVIIGGIPAAADGSAITPHTSIAYPYPTHGGSVVGGSAKVYIEGNLAGRVGDSIDCGDVISAGVAKVLVG